MHQSLAIVLAAAGLAAAQLATTSEPALSQIQAAQATTLPVSPKSSVQGLAFQQFYQVWLENTDYSSAFGDENQQFLAQQGIALTNYWATTHPSEPNYVASASGDTYGDDTDNYNQYPANISTIGDLLDTKGIAWGEYQEDIPYPGFQGFNYSNQQTYANDYVRKHNPLIQFNSVASNATRLGLIKNFTSLESDIIGGTLPQWAFITPNMTDDGHDTNITFASVWERGFISKLNNTPFWDNSLILLTFDESEQYAIKNKVFSVLLGGAIPNELIGTSDDTFYTHYSAIASVSANWGLPSLGRWDCGANLFQIVANKTGYTNYVVDTTNLYLNQTADGPKSTNTYNNYTSAWPVPATNEKCSAGYGILQQVKDTWGKLTPTFNYTAPFPYAPANGLDLNVAYSRNGTTYVSGVNSTGSAAAASSSSSSSSTSTASGAAKTSSGVASPGVVTPGVFTALIGGILALIAGL